MASSASSPSQLAIDFFTKAINQQNFDVMAQILSLDYTYNGEASSLEGNKEWVIGLHAKYPGLEFTFEDMLEEGLKAAFRWRMTAPPLGDRPAGWTTGTNIVQALDGQIVSNFQNGLTSSSWTPPAAESGN